MKKLVSRRKSVFTRFIGFFLMTIIPIVIIAIILYSWQIRLLDDTTVAAFDSATVKSIEKVDNELNKVKALAYDTLHDVDLLMLSSASPIMSQYEKTVSINRYIERLGTLRKSSSYIEEIQTYIPAMNRIIDDKGNLLPDSTEILRIYEDSKQQMDWHFTVHEDELYYLFLPSGTRAGAGDFTFLIMVKLSSNQIMNELGTIGGAEKAILYDPNHTYVTLDRGQAGSETSDLATMVLLEPELTSWRITGQDIPAWIVNHHSDYLGLSLAAYLPVHEINPQVRELRLYFIVFSLLIILTVIGLTYMTAKLIKKPIRQLLAAFKDVEDGNLDVQLLHRKNDEFYYIYHSFNTMVSNIQDLMEQVYNQKILAQNAQLKQLQSQINPHFLYNSFFVISNMARLKDTDSVKRFSEYLAKYYQFITQKETGDILFSAEVEHCRNYADIQKLRFGDHVDIQFDQVPASAANRAVPRLILQPLVENAFEHGLQSISGQGTLHVHMQDNGETLSVTVENNGDVTEDELTAMRDSLDSDSLSGIVNIHKRLQLRFGKDSGVEIHRSGLGGLRITLLIKGDHHV